MKASLIPWSSVVGSGIVLCDPESDEVIGQLMLMNVKIDSSATIKDQHERVSKEIVHAINSRHGTDETSTTT